MNRVGIGARHYPAYAPKVLWHRARHWLFGPLLGCSCSGPGRGLDGKPLSRPSLLAAPDGSCFRSRWRVEFPARDGYADRLRAAELEKRVAKLERRERERRRRERPPTGTLLP